MSFRHIPASFGNSRMSSAYFDGVVTKHLADGIGFSKKLADVHLETKLADVTIFSLLSVENVLFIEQKHRKMKTKNQNEFLNYHHQNHFKLYCNNSFIFILMNKHLTNSS